LIGQELEHVGRHDLGRLHLDDGEKVFRSKAMARSVLARARPATNSK